MRLLRQRPGNHGMTVAQAVDRPSGDKIQVLASVIVPYPCPFPFNQRHRHAVNGMHEVFAFQFLPFAHFHSSATPFTDLNFTI